MVKSPDKPDRFGGFCKSFEKSGFVVLGGCRLGENDCPAEFCDFAGLPALLVGNQGRDMWHHFSRSPEYSDGSENPLDRWTVRQLQNLTAGQGCTVFHPSHRPYWPFEKSGFVVLGGCRLGENDCPAEFCDFAGLPALLVGNQGRDMWHHFSRSPEYSDGSENPLDRWTVRQLQNLTAGQGCTVFHPSHRPYWPFQKIARKCVGIKPSPLGIMIHPEFGLWHGLRGLLVFEEAHEFTSQIKELAAGAETLIHPCDSCELRPCLSACPVSAFENDTLNVKAYRGRRM